MTEDQKEEVRYTTKRMRGGGPGWEEQAEQDIAAIEASEKEQAEKAASAEYDSWASTPVEAHVPTNEELAAEVAVLEQKVENLEHPQT